MFNQEAIEKQQVETIARICHEANRTYCETLGDNSQPNWAMAPDWQRQSAIAGVLNVKNNPNVTPEESHASWLKQKETDGWKYGSVKDAAKKEHPCFVEYDKLPLEQKVKDKLFTAIAKALLFDDKHTIPSPEEK